MNSIKKARKLILSKPTDPTSKVLAVLVLSLESEVPFRLSQLYELGHDDFELAVDVLREWRLDRYYMGKAKLFDTAWHTIEMNSEIVLDITAEAFLRGGAAE